MAHDSDSNSEEKSFWSHLDDLRGVLFRMAAVVAIFAAVLFFFMPKIFDSVILAPCHGDFILYRLFSKITASSDLLPDFSTEGFSVNLININLATQFFTHISFSFWMALVCAFPFMLYFIWSFLSPALYPNERRGARTAFLLGTSMFYIGVAVGYFVVFPITLRFLYDYQLSAEIANTLTLDSYIHNFLMMNLVMGIVFELPLLAWVLSAMGLLKRGFFSKYRRHAIVALLILAAVITPTADPFTLTIVFLPLYLLFELSAFFVKKE